MLKIITATIASIGEKEEGLRSWSTRLEPSSPVRLRSQAVTVVPTFAPRMTPTACESFIIPELTKPITITVVADDD